MQIKFLPENERPMEKSWKYGIDRLSNSELIAMLIHTGTKKKSAIGLAEEILSLFPLGIVGLGSADAIELMRINGIGKSKALTLLAAVELGKRIAIQPVCDKISIESSEDIARMFMEELRYVKKEHFKCVLVNTKGEIILIDEVSIGELSSTVVHPREVFIQAVKRSAAAVIFVHNHPSGDPNPSKEDIDTTKRLVECGELLGIRVLDHVIIGDGRFLSLRGLGLIE